MKKNYGYSVNFDSKTEKLFKCANYLGQGNNGIVYELPKNKIIKIFKEKKICDSEAEILKKTKKSKYFPTIHVHGELYIIREKVEGIPLDKYIRSNGLTKDISRKIYNLLMDFKKMKFTKLDSRCRDIYVTEKLELKMIDPKGCFTRKVDFPRHMMKKMDKLQVLETFLCHIEEIDKNRACYWKAKITEHLKNKENEKKE